MPLKLIGISILFIYYLRHLCIFHRQLNAPQYYSIESIDNNQIVQENSRINILIDYEILKNICKMLTHLKLYESKFETILVNDSLRFFGEENKNLLNILNISEYLFYIEFRLKQINNMNNNYLNNEKSSLKLINIIENIFLSYNNISIIIEKGFISLLNTNNVSDIQKLYNMIVKLNNGRIVELLKVNWTNYMK
jgi:hypothetical protein